MGVRIENNELIKKKYSLKLQIKIMKLSKTKMSYENF